MALSTYFYDPFFTVSVPNVTRELTRSEDTPSAQGMMRPKCVPRIFSPLSHVVVRRVIPPP